MKNDNLLQVGDVVELDRDFDVYTTVPLHFQGQLFNWTLSMMHLKIGDIHGMIGKYVVVKAEMSGGGTGHGPHDVYPDGWYVTLQNTKNDKIIVHFYQSGCFTCTHKNVPVIGKATVITSVVYN